MSLIIIIVLSCRSTYLEYLEYLEKSRFTGQHGEGFRGDGGRGYGSAFPTCPSGRVA